MYHFSETLGTKGKLISSYGTVIEYRALDNDNFMKQAHPGHMRSNIWIWPPSSLTMRTGRLPSSPTTGRTEGIYQFPTVAGTH